MVGLRDLLAVDAEGSQFDQHIADTTEQIVGWLATASLPLIVGA